jgi:membrane fusion protein, multidrug efflux system
MLYRPGFLAHSFPKAIALLFLCALTWASSAHAQAEDPKVIVQSAVSETVSNRIEALGTLRANESIRLTSNVTKTVTKINFNDGQRVERGQVLVEMTSAEEIALLNEARFTMEEARKQLDRVRSLAQRGAASQAILDQQTREYEAAKARYAAVESRLEDLRLTAPFSGVVGLRNVSVGALVSPGDLITTLIDDDTMKLDFTVPAIHMRSVRRGLPIVARTRALGDMAFEGEVYSIDNQIDPVTRSLTVRALLANEERLLIPGLLMSVELHAQERQAIVISEAALLPRGNSNFVFVIEQQDNKAVAVQRLVETGQRFRGKVEILKGIEEGERIVTHGLQRIRDGQAVQVIAEETGRESLRELLDVTRR